jgi:SAM-dependent methyltransferase
MEEEKDKSEHDPTNIVPRPGQSLTTIGSGEINPYETDPLVNMYCSFDYGERINCLGSLFPQFPVVQAILCEQIMKKTVHWATRDTKKLKAIDIGCAVGRTSFELTRWFDYVKGLDYSARFVQVASMLQT